MSVHITIVLEDGYGSETRVTRKIIPKVRLLDRPDFVREQLGKLVEDEAVALAQDVRVLIPITRAVAALEAEEAS